MRGGISIRVKICGITNVGDALCAEAAGADAVGVVVCSDSPREVSLEKAHEIFSALGPFTTRVCVTHTTSVRDLRMICGIRPDALQVSFPFRKEEAAGIRIIRVLAPGVSPEDNCDAVIIDASHGRGRLFDPAFASAVIARSPVPVILAGGLNPENVGSAVRNLYPYGVDVSTGVEKSPGIKDPDRVRAFIEACRSKDAG